MKGIHMNRSSMHSSGKHSSGKTGADRHDPCKHSSCKHLFGLAVFLLSALLLLPACSQTDGTKKADETEFRIVTSFYPMYIFTRNVAGSIPNISIRNMTSPQTGCLHDYQLRPSDLKALENADAFVINGAGMESFLGKVLEQYPGLAMIEASKGIQLLTDKNGEPNPHLWVAISGAVEEVRQIAAQLAAADPPHADAYRANADAYVVKLEALSKTMHEALDPLPNKKIVTFHEAFPYFAKEFGLEIAAVIEREPGTEPGAGELADTIGIIRKLNVKALFVEPQYAPKAAETIANETGATVYSLDPFVTGNDDDPADSYETVMRKNLDVLKQALGSP